jgi:prefoldin subunit 5
MRIPFTGILGAKVIDALNEAQSYLNDLYTNVKACKDLINGVKQWTEGQETLKGVDEKWRQHLNKAKEKWDQKEQSFHNAYASLQDKLTSLQKIKVDLEEGIGKRNLKIDELRLQIQKLEEKMQLQIEQFDEEKQLQIEDFDSKRNSLNDQIGNLKTEVQEGKTCIEELDGEIKKLHTYVDDNDIKVYDSLITLVDERLDLQRAFEVIDVWQGQTDIKNRFTLLTSCVNDSRLKRTHDAILKACLTESRAISNDEYKLLMWILEVRNRAVPEAKRAHISEPEVGVAFDNNQMKSTIEVRGGKVKKILTPSVMELGHKALVEVEQ